MNTQDTYLTLKGYSEGFYKEKGSKFLAFAFVIKSEEDAKEKLKELKKKYFDARHHCYAYILGVRGEKFRANDDGEPGHSAGDPILGQIRSYGLTNTLIVVVRYFGGTKLGISGLINAYKTTASDAIANNSVVENLIYSELSIQFDYPQLNQAMKIVKDFDLKILSQNMELSCSMTLGVRLSFEEAVKSRIKDIHEIKIDTNT